MTGAEAVICAVFGAYYRAILRENALHYRAGTEILVKLRGRFRKKRKHSRDGFRDHPVAIGDAVTLQLIENPDDDIYGYITAIHERKNTFSRAAFSRRQIQGVNIDRVFIISSVAEPAFNTGFIDRVLVESSLSDISADIIINKCDLIQSESANARINRFSDIYTRAGYRVFRETFSAGVSEPLRERLRGLRVLVSGQSGAGKSTFLNSLAGQKLQHTAEIGRALKGRHTTVNPVMFTLSDGTEIIDLPGVREFGLQHIHRVDLQRGFIEFSDYNCRFEDCIHTHEPGCGIKAAVENGEIPSERYDSYLSILDSLSEKHSPRRGDYRL